MIPDLKKKFCDFIEKMSEKKKKTSLFFVKEGKIKKIFNEEKIRQEQGLRSSFRGFQTELDEMIVNDRFLQTRRFCLNCR